MSGTSVSLRPISPLLWWIASGVTHHVVVHQRQQPSTVEATMASTMNASPRSSARSSRPPPSPETTTSTISGSAASRSALKA